MVWWHLLVGIFIFLFFKEKILAKIEEVKKWIKANADKIDEWKANTEIMNAYNQLKEAVDDAQLDSKWDTTEILYVLGLGIKLFTLIKKYEEVE